MLQASELAIETRGLSRHFGATQAVRGIDLNIQRGSVYGLLGPNGAGKTTTVRMLSTLLPPTGGHARVLGHDIVKGAHAVRSRISLTGQFASVDEDLSGQENLILLARLLGFGWRQAKARADQLLGAFELSDAARRQIKTYSGGMRRRLDIAASLVVTPDLIFLDEPTTGLDPRSRNQVWEIVRGLVAEGTTVLLTTQYLEEADQLAERIAVIDHGSVIAEGTSRELKASVGTNVLHLQVRNLEQRNLARALLTQHLGTIVHLEDEPSSLTVQLSDTEQATRVLAELPQSGIALQSFSLGQPSLDEVFLALTGHPAETDSANTDRTDEPSNQKPKEVSA